MKTENNENKYIIHALIQLCLQSNYSLTLNAYKNSTCAFQIFFCWKQCWNMIIISIQLGFILFVFTLKFSRHTWLINADSSLFWLNGNWMFIEYFLSTASLCEKISSVSKDNEGDIFFIDCVVNHLTFLGLLFEGLSINQTLIRC